MTKRKLVLEGESQPSKVSKVPKAPLPKKSKGKAVELSKRMVIEKPTEQSQPEGELTIQMETQREVIVATKTITRSPEQHVDDPSGHDPKSPPIAVVTPE
nr:hypothetical protein Iba_chr10eCG10790 [Ipomoea batatas]